MKICEKNNAYSVRNRRFSHDFTRFETVIHKLSTMQKTYAPRHSVSGPITAKTKSPSVTNKRIRTTKI